MTMKVRKSSISIHFAWQTRDVQESLKQVFVTRSLSKSSDSVLVGNNLNAIEKTLLKIQKGRKYFDQAELWIVEAFLDSHFISINLASDARKYYSLLNIPASVWHYWWFRFPSTDQRIHYKGRKGVLLDGRTLCHVDCAMNLILFY